MSPAAQRIVAETERPRLRPWRTADRLGKGVSGFPRDRLLATEAAAACRDWAFANLPYGELIAIIEPANSRSVRVAEKLGMASRFDTVYHGRGVSIFGMDNPRGGEKGSYAS